MKNIKLYINEFSRVLLLVKERRLIFFLSLIYFSASFPVFQILFSLLNKNLFDAVEYMEFSLLLDAILIGILLLIATVILEPLAGYLYEKEVLHLNANIKLNLFSHIEKLPISYFDTKHSGEVFARINNDLDRLGETYPKLYELLETVIYGFGCSLVIILIDWRLAIFVMVMGFVTSWINTLFIEPIRKYSDKIQKGQGSNLQGYNDIINGVRHIKIYRITLPIHRLINGNNLVAKLSIQRSGKLAQMTSTNFLLSSINTAGTIVFGAYLINNDYTSLGAVIAVITLQYGLTEMFLDLGSCFANLQSSLSGGSCFLSTI
jgi:ABC-type bacteriocin/lantibiotic exporter with double-glycine peptidase domain